MEVYGLPSTKKEEQVESETTAEGLCVKAEGNMVQNTLLLWTIVKMTLQLLGHVPSMILMKLKRSHYYFGKIHKILCGGIGFMLSLS